MGDLMDVLTRYAKSDNTKDPLSDEEKSDKGRNLVARVSNTATVMVRTTTAVNARVTTVALIWWQTQA